MICVGCGSKDGWGAACSLCQAEMFPAYPAWVAFFARQELALSKTAEDVERERVQHFQERRSVAANSWGYESARHHDRARIARVFGP